MTSLIEDTARIRAVLEENSFPVNENLIAGLLELYATQNHCVLLDLLDMHGTKFSVLLTTQQELSKKKIEKDL